jgi:uncharacterized protein
MNVLDKFNVDIFKLSNEIHDYDFEFDNRFFAEFENSIVSVGKGTVKVKLEKNESFIKMTINVDADIELECDRTLDKFSHPIKALNVIIFKYGEEEKELDDDIVVIKRNTQRINLGQYIYEFIGTEIPMKKLHPRFDNTDDEDELIYSSNAETEEDTSKEVDPRWNALKNLK